MIATTSRFVRHVRGLWPGAGALLPLPFGVWLAWCLAHGERRWELIAITFAVFGLAWGSARTKRLFVALYPLALFGLAYDGMRFVKDVGLSPSRIHLCDLRALEMRFFGVDLGGGVRGTAHDRLQAHPSTILDLVCAVPYGTFLFVTVAFAVYLYRKDPEATRTFGWTLLVLNLCGFVTYHLYPAAPPWYFHAHGCAVDMGARASEGPRLAHVDALLGVGYFRGFYGRSTAVFGAVPSLHCAYPLLILLHGYRAFGPVLRAASIAFFATMCFAAVYLDHHWILDVLLGVTYTLVVHHVIQAVRAAQARRSVVVPSLAVGEDHGG